MLKAGFYLHWKMVAMLVALCLWGAQAMAVDGLTTVESAYGTRWTGSKPP